MQVLSRDSLPLGGFAGLTEHRLVTDSRVFGARKPEQTFEGIGHFIYLADAKFNPLGETGMHPHHEIDVISIMVDGQVLHQGSLEHGNSLKAGDAQVQRAGGEGFAHNEINPDTTKNRMLQLWVLPEQKGEKAGYQYFTEIGQGVTRIYGGDEHSTSQFKSRTCIDLVELELEQQVTISDAALIYVYQGEGLAKADGNEVIVRDGDLISASGLTVEACNAMKFVVITA